MKKRGRGTPAPPAPAHRESRGLVGELVLRCVDCRREIAEQTDGNGRVHDRCARCRAGLPPLQSLPSAPKQGAIALTADGRCVVCRCKPKLCVHCRKAVAGERSKYCPTCDGLVSPRALRAKAKREVEERKAAVKKELELAIAAVKAARAKLRSTGGRAAVAVVRSPKPSTNGKPQTCGEPGCSVTIERKPGQIGRLPSRCAQHRKRGGGSLPLARRRSA